MGFIYFRSFIFLFKFVTISIKTDNCGREIGVKKDWYTKLPTAAYTMYGLGTKLGFDNVILSPFLGKFGQVDISGRINSAVEAAKISTGFVGLASDLLSATGLKVALPDEKKKIALRYTDRLLTIGVTKRTVDDLYTMALNRDSSHYLSDITRDLREILSVIKQYLSNSGFPSEFRLNNIFKV